MKPTLFVIALWFCLSAFGRNGVCFGFSARGRRHCAAWIMPRHAPPIVRRLPPSGVSSTDDHEWEEDPEEWSRGFRKGVKICGATAKKSVANFWYGATQIHENYLDLWGKTFLPSLKYIIPVYALFIAGNAIDNAPLSFLSETVRSALERVLLLMYVCTELFSNLLILGLGFPFVLAKGLVRGKISKVSDVSVLFLNYFKEAVTRDENPEPFTLPKSKQWLLIIILPLMEELIFRLSIWRLWKFIGERKGAFQKSITDDSDPDKSGQNTAGFPTWALVSSFLFAVIHVPNHLPVQSAEVVASTAEVMHNEFLKSIADKERATRLANKADAFAEFAIRYVPVVCAMIQVMISFLLSCSVFCPVFQSKGVMGSLGSHLAWNLFAILGWKSQIFWRLLIRKIRKRKQSRKKKDVDDS